MLRRSTRRRAALALAVVGVSGLGIASAAQLTVSSRTLQAGSATVGECQPATQAVAVSFTSAFASGAYNASGVTLSNVAAACGGKTYRIQVATTAGLAIDLNGAAAGTDLTGTLPAGGGSVAVTMPSTAVSTIGSVAVVFAG